MKVIEMSTVAARQNATTAARPVPAVRPAQEADAAMLADLHVRCMGTAFDTVNREFSRMVATPVKARAFIDAALNDQNASVMVLRIGNRPVGYAVARRTGPDAPAKLEAIGVLDSERLNGYGRILLRNVAREMGGIEVHTPVGHGFFAKVAQPHQQGGESALVSVGAQGLMVSSRHMGAYSLNVR